MEYIKTKLQNIIEINNIITIHYFEFAKDYVYEGELHDFWEFVYVDKGEVEIMADTKGYKLKQGETIFHKPNEFHNLWANGTSAPNLVVISFECNSPHMKYFENRLVSVANDEKKLLAQIIKEAMEAFKLPLSDSSSVKLERKEQSFIGSEQLIKIFLEQFLISIMRRDSIIAQETRLFSPARERSNEDMANKIIGYMRNNINGNLTFNDVCKFSKMGETNLKTMFKEMTSLSVIEYYKMLKIEEGKRLIREESYNITEIAEKLGYSSIHYFSRHFKNVTKMAPSEYAISVKGKI